MDPQPVPPSPRFSGRRRIKIVLAGIGVLLAALIVVLALAPSSTTIEWLSEPFSAQIGPPGKLAQVKAKLANVAGPLWRPFRRNRRQIVIGMTLCRLSPDAVTLSHLGAPVSTNANGLRAWLLRTGSRPHIEMSPDAVSGATPTLIVADGTKTGLRFQRSGTNDSLNMLMSFAPKIMGDSVRLDIGVAWTGGTMPPANTNLFSCRALLPRTGSLAVECPEARWNDGKHCWFEFYPIVVDSEAKRGKK